MIMEEIRWREFLLEKIGNFLKNHEEITAQKKTWFTITTKESFIKYVAKKKHLNKEYIRALLNGYLTPSLATSSLLRLIEVLEFSKEDTITFISLVLKETKIPCAEFTEIRKSVSEVAKNYNKIPFLDAFVKRELEKLKKDYGNDYISVLLEDARERCPTLSISRRQAVEILKAVQKKSYPVTGTAMKLPITSKLYCLFGEKILPSLIKSIVSPDYFKILRRLGRG